MSAWNAEAMSKLFFSEAESADKKLSEVADEVKTNKSFAQIYDQHLARYNSPDRLSIGRTIYISNTASRCGSRSFLYGRVAARSLSLRHAAEAA